MVASALAAGSAAAVPLGYRASVARDRSLLRCDSGQPQVCLWPEQRGAAGDVRAWADQAHSRLAAAGVPDSGPLMLLTARPTRGEVVDAVARSAVTPTAPECARTGVWPGARAVGPVRAWLTISAGGALQDLNGKLRPDDAQLVRQLVAAPADAQLAWYRANSAAMASCDRVPELDPGRYLADAPGRG